MPTRKSWFTDPLVKTHKLIDPLRNKGTQSFTEYSIGLIDVNDIIELHRDALALHPPDHSDRSSALNDLGISLRYRFKQLGLLVDRHSVLHWCSIPQAIL